MNRGILKTKLRMSALFLVCICTLPVHAINGDPTVISFDDQQGYREIWAFATGDNGTLVTWVNVLPPWTDLGLPSGARFVKDPSAVTYKGADGVQYIDVFATSDSGHLVVDHWDGSNWTWDDLSAESGFWFGVTPIARHPYAISYLDQFGSQQIRVFSADDQHNLWLSTCESTCVTLKGDWQGLWWFEQITNQSSVGDRHVDFPTAAHFIDSDGRGRTYVFGERDAKDTDFGVYIDAFISYDDSYSGTSFLWADLGLPYGDDWIFAPAAVTQDLSPDGVLQSFPSPCATFHVFAVGGTMGMFPNGGHLLHNLGCRDTFFGLDVGNYWKDEGIPSQLSPPDGVASRDAARVISYIDPFDNRPRLHVFFVGSSGELFRAFWKTEDYGSPIWSEHGFPNGGSADEPALVAFVEAGLPYVYAFSTATNGHLVVNSCIGSLVCDNPDGHSWTWQDLGTM